jgi:predicted enzyme related to lactoylglutathione lyase
VTTGVIAHGRSQQPVSQSIKIVLFPVKDLEKSKAVFSALLGKEPDNDAPYYVGYEAGDQHIGLNPGGHAQGMTGPVVYWPVDDIDGRIKKLTDAGATVDQPPTEVGPGRKVASLRDADGNPFGLVQDS